MFPKLENLRSERDDLHEILLTKLTGHRSENASTAGVLVFVDNHDCVVVEAQNGTVATPNRSSGTNNNSAYNLALFNIGCRNRLTNVSRDNITDTGGAGSLSDNSDHLSDAGTGIIGNLHLGFHLDHDCFG